MSQNILVLIEHLQGRVLEISYVLLAAARSLAQASGGSITALLLGHGAGGLARDLNADEVHYLDHPSLAEFTSHAYLQTISSYLETHSYRLILMGHTSIGMDLVAGLSVRLDIPIISQCLNLGPGDTFSSQICGGKIIAQGELPTPTALVTLVPGGYPPDDGHSQSPPKVVDITAPDLKDLRVELRQYIVPESGDVDISKEECLVAVGRGIQNEDDLQMAGELAEALNGAVCASRPIVDKGWLPLTRLVGKSGLRIAPKLYMALGISGAPEHVEAITESGLIIGVNTDPNAPIFDIAQYGVEIDLYDLLPSLIEQLKQTS